MLLLNLILLIEVTFSTPTPDYAQNLNERCGVLTTIGNQASRKKS